MDFPLLIQLFIRNEVEIIVLNKYNSKYKIIF